MKSKRYIYFIGLSGLVLFDAFQQNYYLQNFNISDNEIPLTNLIFSHFVRWIIWGLIALITYATARKMITKSALRKWQTRILLIAVIVLSSVSLISLYSILQQNLQVTTSVLWEFGQFFFFQKALAFSLASLILLLQIDAFRKTKKLEEASMEIYELKQAIKAGSGENRFIQIRTGYKMKKIGIEEIVWIQSDDYCSKVHTVDDCFTIRRSLKSFENDLQAFRFLRIHRGAILNLDYLDQINLKKSTVRLKTNMDIPASKTGIRILKEKAIVSEKFTA